MIFILILSKDIILLHTNFVLVKKVLPIELIQGAKYKV